MMMGDCMMGGMGAAMAGGMLLTAAVLLALGFAAGHAVARRGRRGA